MSYRLAAVVVLGIVVSVSALGCSTKHREEVVADKVKVHYTSMRVTEDSIRFGGRAYIRDENGKPLFLVTADEIRKIEELSK